MKARVFRIVVALAAVAAVAGIAGAGGAAGSGKMQSKIRIGVYDNRPVAIACARAGMGPVKQMKQKMAEYEAAKKAGDTAKMKMLEAWGESQQRLLHFQGFGHVPVGDLLAPVRPQLAQLLREKHLAAIAMECDVTAPNVETVDVTAAIVELFHPDAKTREAVAAAKGVKPLSLIELADMPAKD